MNGLAHETREDVECEHVLGLLVLIRTFLAWSLAVEMERRWPWQARSEPGIHGGIPVESAGRRIAAVTPEARDGL
jgi:hypothetical protein